MINTESLAQISIWYNHLGQFVFEVTGQNEDTKILARTLLKVAQNALSTDKIVIADNTVIM